MRRRTQILLYTAAMSAALCSCAKEIVMDAGDEPLVAVECVLTQQSVQTLRSLSPKARRWTRLRPSWKRMPF